MEEPSFATKTSQGVILILCTPYSSTLVLQTFRRYDQRQAERYGGDDNSQARISHTGKDKGILIKLNIEVSKMIIL